MNTTFLCALICAAHRAPAERPLLAGAIRDLLVGNQIADTVKGQIRELLTTLDLWQPEWAEWPEEIHLP